MIIAFVQFQLPAPLSLVDAQRLFESSAPKYRDLPGLIRKHYVLADDGLTAGGLYWWEDKAAAERVYHAEWRERVRALYGVAPQIAFFHNPVSVDNRPPA